MGFVVGELQGGEAADEAGLLREVEVSYQIPCSERREHAMTIAQACH